MVVVVIVLGQVSMLEVPLLTEDQCRVVAEATAEAISVPGFVPAFAHFDPSTEVPVQDLPTEVRCRAAVACTSEECTITFCVRVCVRGEKVCTTRHGVLRCFFQGSGARIASSGLGVLCHVLPVLTRRTIQTAAVFCVNGCI